MCIFHLHICMYNTYMPGTHRGQKKALAPLALESQMVVNHCVGSGIIILHTYTKINYIHRNIILETLKNNFVHFTGDVESFR